MESALKQRMFICERVSEVLSPHRHIYIRISRGDSYRRGVRPLSSSFTVKLQSWNKH